MLGAPRSGTTFLASLVALTRFGTPVESHFVNRFMHRLASYEPLSDEGNRVRLIRDIMAMRSIQQWESAVSPETVARQLGDDASYADVVDAVQLLHPDRHERGAWAEKTPHYLADLQAIDALFPDARYLFIVRDGRDVALSLLRKPWGPNNVYACARYWSELNDQVELIERLRASGRLMSLRYEDLLESTEAQARAIHEFLDEPWDDERMAPLLARTLAGNHGKWREEMRAKDIALFDSVAADVLALYGYPVGPTRSLSRLERTFHELDDRARWLGFMFRANVIDGIRIRFFGARPFAD